MSFMRLRWILAFCLGLNAQSGFCQKALESYLEILRQIPANYRQHSSVSEELARLHLYDEYPIEDYEIARSVHYKFESGEQGELDLVVIHRATRRVVLVAEVKEGVSRRAVPEGRKQLNRFLRGLDKKGAKRIWMDDADNRQMNPWQFGGAWAMNLIGLKGQNEGDVTFDRVISLTKGEVVTLAKTLRREFKKQSKVDFRAIRERFSFAELLDSTNNCAGLFAFEI